ncbi:hypothetical protein NLM27_26030 [Bradyrhizobium sp. CCGB12]|uniref:hypothetical protein n=1 Tax=Bradyrhizobium sp. CCGB12 TaxID=2949632 RepID=UPI0020B1F5DB|nr:hypothetical protein [Bradyrhizobium sp. CCGB12]MCP3392233.1 hypothetical protein [Bradyrhizobium sp. CCGB12]
MKAKLYRGARHAAVGLTFSKLARCVFGAARRLLRTVTDRLLLLAPFLSRSSNERLGYPLQCRSCSSFEAVHELKLAAFRDADTEQMAIAVIRALNRSEPRLKMWVIVVPFGGETDKLKTCQCPKA